MQRRDYYFIAGGIFIFLVVIFLVAFFMTRKAKGEDALAQAFQSGPPQVTDYAHKAVAAPEAGFIGGGSVAD